MLDMVVRYLHDGLVPFHLSSYPSLEPEPKAAHPIPKHGIFVDVKPLLAGDRLVLACYPAHEHVDLATLTNELDCAVTEASADELPEQLKYLAGPLPPLGQLFGMPLIIDEELTHHATIVFRAFGDSDFFELPYEDFARQEAPRVASFTRAGELPPAVYEEEAATSH